MSVGTGDGPGTRALIEVLLFTEVTITAITA
jgi:hypothetical protein